MYICWRIMNRTWSSRNNVLTAKNHNHEAMSTARRGISWNRGTHQLRSTGVRPRQRWPRSAESHETAEHIGRAAWDREAASIARRRIAKLRWLRGAESHETVRPRGTLRPRGAASQGRINRAARQPRPQPRIHKEPNATVPRTQCKSLRWVRRCVPISHSGMPNSPNARNMRNAPKSPNQYAAVH